MARAVRLTRYRVAPAREAPAPRMTVALVADLHCCTPFMSTARIEGLVNQVNGLRADLVLLLGDYAGHVHGGRDLPPHRVAPLLARLEAPLGVYSVFGNHDWRDDAQAQRTGRPTHWHVAFAEAGLNPLSNAAVDLEQGGVAFQLAGLESQLARPRKRERGPRGHDDWPRLEAVLDPARFTLLMAHEPDIFPDLPGFVDLTVSGHTHGGQIAPFGRALYVPSRHGLRYAYGHHTEGSRQLVVSGGLGYSGPPIRIGRPPEIVLMEVG